MESQEFFGKFLSKYLWGNLLAMALTVVLICVGVKYGLDIYTHHGEGVPVPNLTGMDFNRAADLLERNGLRIVVSDSGYNKRMPAECVLAQSPGEGTNVKQGHTIYVTVNSPSSPTVAIPDIIDNSSVREATAKLTALGFKLLEPQIVIGERDWVYGIVSRGRRLNAGDRISIEQPLTLLIGSGEYDSVGSDIEVTEPEDVHFDTPETDDFEEVTMPE